MVIARAPKGLQEPGKRLWRDVCGGYELRPDELRVLESAARMADRIELLEQAMEGQPAVVVGSKGQQVAHPLLAEIRLQRVAMSGLLRGLRLPDQGTTPNQQREAASSRWAKAYGNERATGRTGSGTE